MLAATESVGMLSLSLLPTSIFLLCLWAIFSMSDSSSPSTSESFSPRRSPQKDRVSGKQPPVSYSEIIQDQQTGGAENGMTHRARSKSLSFGRQAFVDTRHIINTSVDNGRYHHIKDDSPKSAVSAPASISYRSHFKTEWGISQKRDKDGFSSPSSPRRRILFYHKHERCYGFTNFSPHSVCYKGKIYPTSEHLFQSLKFIHKPNLAEHIRTCDPRPSIALSEAGRFQPEVRPDWRQVNISMMDKVLWRKFTQNEDLKVELLSTGDAELVENSDRDAFWGVGSDGKGRNELGKALERLREKLRT